MYLKNLKLSRSAKEVYCMAQFSVIEKENQNFGFVFDSVKEKKIKILDLSSTSKSEIGFVS